MLQSTEVITHTFSAAEKLALETGLSDLPYPVHGPYDEFVAAARGATATGISPVTTRVLHAFKNDRSAPGALVLNGCPYDESITRGLLDAERDFPPQSASPSEALLVGIVAQIGEPYSIYQEGKGLVNNVCPSLEHVGRVTGLGSKVALGLHIENAAGRVMGHDRAPEGLALIGVSREPGAGPGTAIADGRAALAALKESEIDELLKPQFLVNVPERWRQEDSRGFRVTTPLVLGTKDDPRFVAALYGDMVKATTLAGASALSAFTNALEAVSVEVVIEPGMMVLLNNQTVFHGRGSFDAAFDENGRPYRWLQRVFWTTSLRRFGTWPFVNDRVISARAE